MTKAVKIISVFLVITLLFSACSKKAEDETPETTTEQVENTTEQETTAITTVGAVRLPFNEADGINPFFAKSYENLYLARLLYSSLFAVNSKYEPIPVVAESISVDGKTATVRIKSGLSCHGSSAITAADVVYSFNKAKNSYAYKDTLLTVKSAEAYGNTVTFTSKFADKLIAGKLTFPIVKADTADLESDIPVGFGEYYFYENSLVSVSGDKENIRLTSINTADTAFNAYKIGNTDVFFSDLSDCEYKQSHGDAEIADLNNMIYLGLNSDMGALDKNIRSAIALIIDAQDICEESYQGHAVPCKLPCNPNAQSNKEFSSIPLTADLKTASSIIDRCGYTRYAGKALTNGAYVLSFSLIVNNDNKYRVAAAYEIADALNKSGFYIEVKPLSFDDYSERIESGNYQMYLGEIKLDQSLDLSPFFLKSGKLVEGIDRENVAKAYTNMRAGKISNEAFFESFISSYPFVPIGFRTGYVFTSNNFHGDFSRFPYDLYYGV